MCGVCPGAAFVLPAAGGRVPRERRNLRGRAYLKKEGMPRNAAKDRDEKTQIQLSDHFTYQKLLRFVLPSIVMMVFTSIYGVVDGLFVSNFAGKTPFAAINLVMPFIMVLGGIGFMIGTGGTALVSKVLGEGEPEKAKRYFTIWL